MSITPFITEEKDLEPPFFTHISTIPLLCAEEEKSLAARIAGGDREAHEQLFLANMRLVVFIAKRYVRPGVSLDDLVQEAAIGLLKAIPRFNPARGMKFSTYATWWIRQACARVAPELERAIRLPVHVEEDLRACKHAVNQLESEGREATVAALAKLTGKSVEQICFFQSIDRQMLSLDVELSDIEKSSTYAEVIEDESANFEESIAEYLTERAWLAQAFLKLPKREQDVLKRRFGMEPYERPQTFNQISQDIHISRERIRQIEVKALERLKYMAARQGERRAS